ncbi:flagellar hook-length control protein FliK [Sulfitobacter sp. OXR-159]|uniref:flagellar hook-length control protein FliK n=1 Tax=Sulfitobacter sp. OXR-159 TaxID=3100174 RepID=UPI002AC95E86|nr:flagellar hook-length control protein FliK [Sulfitobacter sp. OXR-159]WPZ28775.1 flagellar hook-length control protein FliK [Sulfitobacter sp. OXR-159]
MIAQLQAAPAVQTAAGLGQPPQKGAVEGFATLMQGMAGQEATPEPQVQAMQTPLPETDTAEDALPEGIDLETAEGLMALMDRTIAGLEETNNPVTPKAALAAFAEALGAAPPDSVGALEAVAQFDDPSLEAALEEKLGRAMRIPTPASQLSIASAVVPVVGRIAIVKGQALGMSEGAAPALQIDGIVGQVTAKPVTSGDTPVLRLAPASTAEMVAAPVAAGEASTVPAAQVDLSAEAADPRITAATDRFSAAVDVAKAPQPGTSAPAAEAALREVAALTAPQAPQSEGLRLSPPQPTPAPAPNPAAAPDEQLRQHVSQQIRGLDTADNKLRFSLSPYGMGEIEIEVVRSETGRMQIAMTTESASVLNMLRQDREQLLDALQSRGISADNADLDFQTFDDRGRNGGQQQGPEFTQKAAQANDAPGSDAQPLPQPPSSNLSAGQLDILT